MSGYYTLTRAAGAAFALLVAGCGIDVPSGPDAKVSVTATQPSGTVAPGDQVAFRVTVANAGPDDADALTITTSLASGLVLHALTCSPLGPSASTPTTQAPCDLSTTVKLAKGASVTFDVVATVTANATGTLGNRVDAGSLFGSALVSAANQVTVVDNRAGSYTAFTSDGRRVPLAADFAGRTLTLDTGAAAVGLHFTPQSTVSSNLFDAGTGFMTHRDLLAGNLSLDGATPVFFAARSFVTSAAALDGHAFNVFGIATPASGAATSSFESVAFRGATMQVCAAATPQAVANCPANSLHGYALSVTGGVFTGIDAASGDTRSFQVAQSGGTLLLLRAEPVASGRAFQVGLSTNAGVVTADMLLGGDNLGRWGSLSLTSGGMEEAFTQVSTPLATALQLVAGQPAGLANGLLASGIPVYLAEDGGVAVVAGTASGLIQVFAH